MTDFATGEPYNQYLVFVIEQQYLLAAYEYTWRAMWLLWHIMWQKWRHSQSQKSEEDWGTAIIDMHRKFDEVLTCCFQDIWVVRQPDALITILCTVFHPPSPLNIRRASRRGQADRCCPLARDFDYTKDETEGQTDHGTGETRQACKRQSYRIDITPPHQVRNTRWELGLYRWAEFGWN